MSDTHDAGTPERRVHVELREIFSEAYDVLEPFFDPQNRWAGHSHEHLAHLALHERFPQLSAYQLMILIEAAQQVFEGKRPPA